VDGLHKTVIRSVRYTLAVFHGHLEIVMFLVEHCHVDVTVKNKDGVSAMRLVSANGHMGVIRYLVEGCHLDMTLKDHDGWTVFHFACANGYLKVVQHLLATHSVDANAKVNDGWTALHITCANGHMDIVQFLVEYCDFDIHGTTNMDQTAYDIAYDYEQSIVVVYLMSLPKAAQVQKTATCDTQNPPNLTQTLADVVDVVCSFGFLHL
jgi:ankyrin repeat protein